MSRDISVQVLRLEKLQTHAKLIFIIQMMYEQTGDTAELPGDFILYGWVPQFVVNTKLRIDSRKINNQHVGMVDSHNKKYFQIDVGVRVGMQQQTDEKVKIEAIAATSNIVAAQQNGNWLRNVTNWRLKNIIEQAQN